MTGRVGETERERQLQEFASRLLDWPDHDGPASFELIPLSYPDELPSELVENSGLRFLGSAVRRRDQVLLEIQLLFEGGSMGPNDLLNGYEAGLLKRGWQLVGQPGLQRGGFEGSGFGAFSTLLSRERGMHVFLHAFERGGFSELRVRYWLQADGGLEDPAPRVDQPESPLPALRPPPGVRMRSEGSGGGGGNWTSTAKARTEMAPMELEAYFAKQMEAAGWGRTDGSADELFAWSGWSAPQIPPSRQWRAVLIVLAAFPGERSLSLRADEIKSP